MSTPYPECPYRRILPRRSTWAPLWPILLLLLVAVGLVWWFRPLAWFTGPLHDPNAAPQAITPRGDLAADEQSTIELYENASRSVVHITPKALRRHPLPL